MEVPKPQRTKRREDAANHVLEQDDKDEEQRPSKRARHLLDLNQVPAVASAAAAAVADIPAVASTLPAPPSLFFASSAAAAAGAPCMCGAVHEGSPSLSAADLHQLRVAQSLLPALLASTSALLRDIKY